MNQFTNADVTCAVRALLESAGIDINNLSPEWEDEHIHNVYVDGRTEVYTPAGEGLGSVYLHFGEVHTTAW